MWHCMLGTCIFMISLPNMKCLIAKWIKKGPSNEDKGKDKAWDLGVYESPYFVSCLDFMFMQLGKCFIKWFKLIMLVAWFWVWCALELAWMLCPWCNVTWKILTLLYNALKMLWLWEISQCMFDISNSWLDNGFHGKHGFDMHWWCGSKGA